MHLDGFKDIQNQANVIKSRKIKKIILSLKVLIVLYFLICLPCLKPFSISTAIKTLLKNAKRFSISNLKFQHLLQDKRVQMTRTNKKSRKGCAL